MKTKRKELSFFGLMIRHRLDELNMTQRELAESVGIDENYLTAVMRGRRAGHKYKEQLYERLGLKED